MAKRRTLGQIMEDKYLACRNAGIDITESYERAAAAVEREVLRRMTTLDLKRLHARRYDAERKKLFAKKGKP